MQQNVAQNVLPTILKLSSFLEFQYMDLLILAQHNLLSTCL